MKTKRDIKRKGSAGRSGVIVLALMMRYLLANPAAASVALPARCGAGNCLKVENMDNVVSIKNRIATIERSKRMMYNSIKRRQRAMQLRGASY